MDPQAQAIVNAHSELGPQPFEVLEPAQARRQPGPDDAVKRVMADRGLDGPEPVGSVEDLTIPDAADGAQTLRVYKPEGVQTGAPIIVWVHGGGWVLFDINTYDASCRGLSNKTGAIVVSPDYRRAPEAVFSRFP
ncbi:alpha/beta hydrolase [Actinoplanes sp. Pm04-4]|uniref:Alpha/beta hydrolase n=1 Tax=Paractinoplanes pyxinae TaxID=2997416 RepID=A0ABT4BCB6_9ACTN|nr:alpha/beta hydrolase [Actinoplanes pyxinae]MCY1144164.1 alpha/beta hydrolase [Actinoplanes pyxinae]